MGKSNCSFNFRRDDGGGRILKWWGRGRSDKLSRAKGRSV